MSNNPVFCLSLNTKRLGIRKQVAQDSNVYDTEMDREMVHVSKDALKCEEYEAIIQHYRKIAKAVRERGAGNSYLKNGITLINGAVLDGLLQYLENQKLIGDALVKHFVYGVPASEGVEAVESPYLRAKREAETQLGAGFDATEYPAQEMVAQAFGLSWNVFTFPNIDGLKEISPALWAKETEKFAALWDEALSASKQLLRAELNGLLDPVVQALEPGDDGKKRRLNQKTLDKLNLALASFRAREVANDTELQALVDTMQDALKGVDAGVLRQYATTRQEVTTRLKSAKGELDKLVVASGRKYSKSEEDAEPEGAPVARLVTAELDVQGVFDNPLVTA